MQVIAEQELNPPKSWDGEKPNILTDWYISAYFFEFGPKYLCTPFAEAFNGGFLCFVLFYSYDRLEVFPDFRLAQEFEEKQEKSYFECLREGLSITCQMFD